jgi:small subunit ribosomal protein S14
MASKSTSIRMAKVKKTIEKYAELRLKLKKEGDYAALQKLPRNASPTRYRNLCAMTGRSRSVYRKFGISRIKLRESALEGKVPGMRKASW